ncbi:MAG: DNA repair protein RadA, partial [Actinomycetia bacterium]|nr:DNA repair protein RadA [Actinomycetes bacterium]
FGEIGLTGEVRGVRQTGPRLAEAARMGLDRVFLAAPSGGASTPPGAHQISSVREIGAIVAT